MLECFKNLVGSKHCGGEFKSYIESVNISVKKLAGIANGAQITGKDYLASKLEEAIDFVLLDVASNIELVTNPIKNIQYSDTYSKYHAGLRGITYKSTCNLERLFIDFIMFKCNDTVQNKELIIIDGTDTNTYTFNAIAGQVVAIPINQKFNNTLVEILVDNSDVRVANNHPYNCDCICSSNTYGISIVGTYKCDIDLLYCTLSNDKNFINAVKYTMAGLIYEDLRGSSHLSEVVVTKVDNLEEMADTMMHRAEKFTKNAKISFDKYFQKSCCFECNDFAIVNSL